MSLLKNVGTIGGLTMVSRLGGFLRDCLGVGEWDSVRGSRGPRRARIF